MQTATPVLSLVPPETHALAYLAKWGLRAVFLLGVMVALASQATAAPVVFEASGKFSNGSPLSGTVTIDTATGKVLSADLSAMANSVELLVFDRVISVSHWHDGATAMTTIAIGEATNDDEYLYLVVKESTLVGYTGSHLVPGGIPAEDEGGSCIAVRDYLGYKYLLYLDPGSLEPN